MEVPSFLPVEHVPAQAPLQLQLQGVVAATISSKLANDLMKQLGSSSPLTTLRHVKRVRKSVGDAAAGTAPLLDIILCSVEELAHGAAARYPCPRMEAEADGGEAIVSSSCSSSTGLQVDVADLPPAVARIVQEKQLLPFVAAVSLHSPQNREQWTDWSRIWPLNWKIPEGGTSVAPSLTAEDQAYLERHMTAALRLASERVSGSAAAVIVDPRCGTVVARAINQTALHPLDHAVMVAIREAALLRAEGPTEGAQESGASAGRAANNDPDASTQASSQGGQHPVAAAVGEGGGGVGDGSKNKRPRLDGSLDASASPAPAETALLPYMCTGYDVFLTHEPCIMCAMAMVHSRLARVVYCQRDEAHGALGGACRLHSQRSLNHHYLVFHLPLKQQ